MIYLTKFFKHFHTVNKHRFLVFKLCLKAGIPYRGLVHDLSKYSPTEFLESVRFYTGDKSPIMGAKNKYGYSKAWLHHFGRNKHHFEYWYDPSSPVKTPIIPYKYTVEMICDNLAAGLTYQGKNWIKEYQLEYFNNCVNTELINDKIVNVLKDTYIQVANRGINKTITKKNLKKIYYKYIK